MMTVKIVWEGAGEQKKTFDNLFKAVEWCRRNYRKLVWINGYYTACRPVCHFDLIDMLEKGDNK
jgi:hypothetical protein